MKSKLPLLFAVLATSLVASPTLVRSIGLDGGRAHAPVVDATGTRAALYWSAPGGAYELRMYDLESGLPIWRRALVKPRGENFYLDATDISPLVFSANGDHLFANIRAVDPTNGQGDSQFRLHALLTATGVSAFAMGDLGLASSSTAHWRHGKIETVALMVHHRAEFFTFGESLPARLTMELQSPRPGPWHIASNANVLSNARFAAVSSTGDVLLFDRSEDLNVKRSHDFHQVITKDNGKVLAVAFSPDGTKLRMFGHNDRGAFLYLVRLSTFTIAHDPAVNTEAFYDRGAHTRALSGGARGPVTFGGAFHGGAVFARDVPSMLLGKSGVYSPNCGQLVYLAKRNLYWDTLANSTALSAADSAVAISPDGKHAVLVRNFSFDGLQKESMQLEVWKMTH